MSIVVLLFRTETEFIASVVPETINMEQIGSHNINLKSFVSSMEELFWCIVSTLNFNKPIYPTRQTTDTKSDLFYYVLNYKAS
jgi:phage terminase large subunit-like protein